MDNDTMRGEDPQQAVMFSYLSPEEREPQEHPLQTIRGMVDSSLSQGTRRFDLRQSGYIGLARTHLQQLLTAMAMNVIWVIAWLWGKPLRKRRRKPGHLSRLAPHPLSR